MARKCRHCRKEIPAKAKSDRWQAAGFCDVNCMAAYGLEKARQQRERKALASRDRKRNMLPKKPSNQMELTQRVINKMVRLIDEGLPCISCGRYQCGSGWDAGHFRSVAASPELRLDPRNIHLQGRACNTANRKPDSKRRRKVETIAQEYEDRLRERYDDNLVDWLKGPHEMPRWRDEDLKRLRAIFAAECRRLERGEGSSRDWRATGYAVKDLLSS